MNRLTVANLTRRFGPRVVLDGIGFEVEPGTAAAVVGPNGAGKTTLLRCVVGAEEPDEGTVLLNGRPMVETDPVIRAAMAVLLDDAGFFPDLSVIEHLRLLAFAHGGPDPDIVGSEPGGAAGDGGDDSVDTIVRELGLLDALHQLPATLSSGQRRRLALASCFVRPRDLLVLDEPEQRLDDQGRTWLTHRLLREKSTGRSILMASHDPALVDAVADQQIRLGP